jgi:hypothetical protein
MMLHYVKMLTPRDPRDRTVIGWNPQPLPNRRYFPAYSRDAVCLNPSGVSGLMAWLTRKSDPAYSATMQWSWLEEGASPALQSVFGFENLVSDKRLPAQQPAWTSEEFPWVGAMLRQGFGTPEEHQVLLYSQMPYASQTGSFPGIYAYGTAVAGSFPGDYWFQEPLLTNHVMLARGVGTLAERENAWFGYRPFYGGSPYPQGPTARFGGQAGYANVYAFAALPRQDYAAVDVALRESRPMHYTEGYVTTLPQWPAVPANGKPPVDWRRQVLFLKDDDPGKATYLLIRDSIKGGQPTIWQMWNVSETLDTPDKVRDVAAVLANKPGYKILPARELQGNRFTAIGQQGVDVEYYIAAPTDTPRSTLRWGTEMLNWANKLKYPEYQDLLHLQLPGDGTYYVAFFPRKRNMPAPTFTTLGGGTIIKVRGDFGTDYGFLSALEATASDEGAMFQGTAASVQDRTGGRVLSLGAKGTVRYKGLGLTADFAASLRSGGKTLTITLPEKITDSENTLQPPVPFPGGTVTLTAPGGWALAKPLPGISLSKTADGWTLTVPAGVRTVQLIST